MKIKTTELSGPTLDWAVAKCEGEDEEYVTKPDQFVLLHNENSSGLYCYSTIWAQGGPIIERERITVVCAEGDYSSRLRGYKTFWVADKGHQTSDLVYGSQGDNWGSRYQIDADCVTGPTPLIAAMRCFVAAKLGPEVEIPEELLALMERPTEEPQQQQVHERPRGRA